MGLLAHIILLSFADLFPLIFYSMEQALAKEYLNKFGENLRKLRTDSGNSQRRLASFCKIDHSDISKIERGEVNITLLTVAELAKALKVSSKDLLDFDDSFIRDT